MLAKVPIISSAVGWRELFRSAAYMNKACADKEFCDFLSKHIGSKYIYLTNSGISAFFVILKALKASSKRKEVILPAYTAGSLVVGLIKSGLTPVLCDISLDDFNLDKDSLFKLVSSRTLAVVGAHMFGIIMENLERLREEIPKDIFLIEDCAQAMGGKIRGRQVGSFGDISFFSFNRGKNLPLCGGGCIATNSLAIALAIEEELKDVKSQGIFSNLMAFFKVLSFSFATNPHVYGLGHIFVSCFKDSVPPSILSIERINNFQVAIGLALKDRAKGLFSKRYNNGVFLIRALKDAKGIILPKISGDAYPVFNRLPILFEDLDKKEIAEKELWRVGIETSRMYLKPLHHMFALGYRKEDFPCASYFAEHLLTLPAHPALVETDLEKIIEVIRHI